MLEYDKIRAFSDADSRICVCALSQSGGLGRDGHHWHSPLGGLWFTFDLAWGKTVESLALYAGHCLHKLLIRLFDLEDLMIKWTNDIYHQDKKIAGILCRYQIHERLYVIGLGVNTNNGIFEAELAGKANSLSQILSFEISNQYLMKHYINEFKAHKHLLDTPHKYLDYCNAHLYGLRRTATIDQAGKQISGTITGIDNSGRLILERATITSTDASGRPLQNPSQETKISFGTIINIEN